MSAILGVCSASMCYPCSSTCALWHDAVRVQAFAGIADQVREDVYAHQHLRYYVREVRVLAYSQVRRTPELHHSVADL
jgi:hypothetical protein